MQTILRLSIFVPVFIWPVFQIYLQLLLHKLVFSAEKYFMVIEKKSMPFSFFYMLCSNFFICCSNFLYMLFRLFHADQIFYIMLFQFLYAVQISICCSGFYMLIKYFTSCCWAFFICCSGILCWSKFFYANCKCIFMHIIYAMSLDIKYQQKYNLAKARSCSSLPSTVSRSDGRDLKHQRH